MQINYEIALNEDGRPCIVFPVDYLETTEAKFFILELSRFIISNSFQRVTAKYEIGEDDKKKVADCVAVIGQLSDDVARILVKKNQENLDNDELIKN